MGSKNSVVGRRSFVKMQRLPELNLMELTSREARRIRATNPAEESSGGDWRAMDGDHKKMKPI